MIGHDVRGSRGGGRLLKRLRIVRHLGGKLLRRVWLHCGGLLRL